jgi:hypothetical protein
MAELDTLRMQIQRARWRVRSSSVGSPEWDAAVSGLEELERALRRATRQSTGRGARPSATPQLA